MMNCRWIRPILQACVLVVAAACTQEPPDSAQESGALSMGEGRRVAATTAGDTASAHVSGTATYRERIALPPDASFEATLEDVSQADAAAIVLGTARLEPAGQPPFRFTIEYDPSKLEPGRNYAVRAKVTQAGQLWFTSDRHYALPSAGEELSMLLVRAGGGSSSASTAELENTYWKLVRLGTDSVAVEAEREPYLVLHSREKRVAGYGGCNRILGAYELSGDQLTFSQMAGTMMACAEGMEHEQAFHEALEKVSRWRIEGETLELFDASGVSLAFFESRYM